MTSSEEYLASLPKKICGAGALILNSKGHLLIVQTTYKTDWEIPGGIVNSLESPRKAAEREIFEEIGIVMNLNNILCIDYRTLSNNFDSYQIIFDGGIISDDKLSQIKLCKKEIAKYEFVEPEKAYLLLGKVVGERAKLALAAKREKFTCYLEEGTKISV